MSLMMNLDFFFHRVYSNILNDFKKQEFGEQD